MAVAAVSGCSSGHSQHHCALWHKIIAGDSTGVSNAASPRSYGRMMQPSKILLSRRVINVSPTLIVALLFRNYGAESGNRSSLFGPTNQPEQADDSGADGRGLDAGQGLHQRISGRDP